MSKTTEFLQGLPGEITKRSRREQLLLQLTVLAVVAGLWYSFLAEPLLAERHRLQQQIADTSQNNVQLQLQSSEIIARHQGDPDLANRRRLTQLREEILQADDRLQQMTLGLVPPKEMAQVLEKILLQQPGLRLLKLENRAALALGMASEKPKDSGPEPGEAVPKAYRHGLRLEFEGSYLAALAYLHQLESLPYRFIWDEFELEVMKHPKARIVIVVHTLSLQKGWIGV